MRAITPALVVVSCLDAAGAAACPATFENSLKVAVDRDGGEVEVGDLIDWTVTVINDGCHAAAAAAATVTDVVDPLQEFVSADLGGVYDPATRTVTWSPATTPELVSVPALGGSVAVHLTTQVVQLGGLHRACNRASILGGMLGPDLTDDPATAPVDDPTCLPAFVPFTASAVTPCQAAPGAIVTLAGSGFDGSEVTSLGEVVGVSGDGLQVEVGLRPPTFDGRWRVAEWVSVQSPYQSVSLPWAFAPASGNPAAQLRMVKRSPDELEVTWEGGPWSYVVTTVDPSFECRGVSFQAVDGTRLVTSSRFANQVYFRAE